MDARDVMTQPATTLRVAAQNTSGSTTVHDEFVVIGLGNTMTAGV